MLDTVFRVLKITVIIGICAVFMVAINALLVLVSDVMFDGVIGEFFSMIGMYLPFDAGAVFNPVFAVGTAITAFMVARKIFDLTSWGVNSV